MGSDEVYRWSIGGHFVAASDSAPKSVFVYAFEGGAYEWEGLLLLAFMARPCPMTGPFGTWGYGLMRGCPEIDM